MKKPVKRAFQVRMMRVMKALPHNAAFLASIHIIHYNTEKTLCIQVIFQAAAYIFKTQRKSVEIPRSTTEKKRARKTTVEITVIVYVVSSFRFGQLTLPISERTLRKNCVMRDIC
jgi:hypothetical protein